MKIIKPFNQLEQDESEVPKNECAKYLDLYYKFVQEMLKNPKEPFIDIFRRIKYRDNGIKMTPVNFAISIAEYDYMIQIAEFYLINKYYSILVDNNITHMDESVSNDYFDDDYYLSDSTRFTKKNLIKLIRNALNHNDKSDFELFRLIKSRSNANLQVEIFLRKPNMHLKTRVHELAEIFKEVGNIRSFYDYEYKDENGELIVPGKDYERDFERTRSIDLVHYTIPNLGGEKKEIFRKSITIDESQKSIARDVIKSISRRTNQDCFLAWPDILRDLIPFGMTKIYGYNYDIHGLMREIVDPQKTYEDVVKNINLEKFGNMSLEAEWLFYSLINKESVIDRAFSLFASYVLDSVITDDEFVLNGKAVKKNSYRNAFVHGRWYTNDKDFDERNLTLRDYEHGDDNIMVPSNSGNSEIQVKQNELYNSLKCYVKEKNYDLPISFISLEEGKSLYITYRKDGVGYFCNMSFNKITPIFLLLGQRDGNMFIADNKDFDVFAKEIEMGSLTAGIDPRLIEFVKKMPEISKKALTAILESDTEEEYNEKLKDEIRELLKIYREIELGIKPDQPVQDFFY